MKEQSFHLFFLNYSDQLPRSFVHLSTRLAANGIQLVPVAPADLVALARPHKQFVMSLIPDMTTHARHQAFRKQYLDFALKNKKFRLFEISTFAESEELTMLRRLECYDYLKLPMPIDYLVRKLSLAIMSEDFDTKAWPGGRRAKLPTA